MAFHTIFSDVKRMRECVEARSKIGGDERAKTGFEAEFLLIDGDGRVSNDADNILSRIKNEETRQNIYKECCHSYIEVRVQPLIYLSNVASKFFDSVLDVLDIVEESGLGFYPLAMYPYKYTPKMRYDGWYGSKMTAFGEKWGYAGRCAGFHFHYSLPQGIFDYGDRHLIEDAAQSEKLKTVNCYNLGLAADPALTAFTQSSPLFQGKFLGKDSRVIIYRGGEALGFDGLYSDYPDFGAMPPYAKTYEDLVDMSKRKAKLWEGIIKKAGGDIEEVKKKNELDFAWNPIKINKVGSIELRGMDMNFPSTLTAVGILAKYVLRDTQRRSIEVVADDLAVKEPFRFEEGEVGRVYVPPFRHLNTILQHDSAWEGLDNDAVYDYCKKFFGLCLRFVNKKYYPLLKPIKEILKDRKTRSDELLGKIRKRGYDPKEEVDEEVLRGIVLEYSGKLRADIERTKDLMAAIQEGSRI